MTAVPIFTRTTNPPLGVSQQGQIVGLKVQLASDESGDYVPVVALDADLGISIGAVSQEGTWVVTANAGTNLNTSTLALETGGNLAALAGTITGGKLKVDPSGVTSPVSAAALPLPANAAQETGGNLATLAGAVSAGKVQATVATALPAGSNLIGKVGIDQTTPGTTNKVSIGTDGTVALGAGAATIGAVTQGTSPWLVQHPDTTSTGNTIAAGTLNAAYTVTLANGEAATGFTISGLTASAATLTLEGSAADGVTFSAINEIQTSGVMGSAITTDGNYYVNTGGRAKVRLRVSVIGTGTITIASLASSASSRVTVQASLPPGQNAIGNVGGKTVSVTVTPTVTASNSYGTNYVVGGLLTFANAFTSTGSGILQSVVVTCKKVETSGFTLFVFNGNPTNTTWTDAAVAAINANDVSLVREPVSMTANSQLGTHTVAYATGLGQAMAPGSTTLYGVLIANATLTNQFGSTSDITVTVKILQDC